MLVYISKIRKNYLNNYTMLSTNFLLLFTASCKIPETDVQRRILTKKFDNKFTNNVDHYFIQNTDNKKIL